MLLFVVLGVLPIFIVYGSYILFSSLLTSLTVLNIINLILGLVGVLGIFFYIYFVFSAQIGILLSLTSNSGDKSKEIFKKARKYFWSYLLVVLATLTFVMLWSVLFIIPGIIMAIYYNFSIFSLIFEGYSGLSALKRSKELVKNYWWAVFGRMLFVSVIFWLLGNVLGLPGLLFEKGSVGVIIWNLVANIFLVILTPISVIYSYLMFVELKKIKPVSQIEKKSSKGKIIAVVAGGVVVALLIGVSFAIPALNNARDKARDIKRISNIKEFQTVLEIYKIDNGIYPSTLNDLVEKDYFEILPKNPLPNGIVCPENFDYSYNSILSGQDYNLKFCLEADFQDFKAGMNILKSSSGTLLGDDFDFSEIQK